MKIQEYEKEHMEKRKGGQIALCNYITSCEELARLGV